MADTHLIEIHFESANDAFQDGPGEAVRILREIADRWEATGDDEGGLPIRDANGNTIGKSFYSVAPAQICDRCGEETNDGLDEDGACESCADIAHANLAWPRR